MILAGRKVVVTGVVTRRSIAFAVAREVQAAGAELVLTSFGRARRMTERAARALDTPPDVLELDATSDADATALASELGRRWGRVDGLLHAIAHAPPDALGGRFLDTPEASAVQAFAVSAFSLKRLAVCLRDELAAARGSVVGLDFDAAVAWPAYDWMGVAKAGLEATARYLARDLGPAGVRVNLVSAGPLETPAASGIPGFAALADGWRRQAPLGWDSRDPAPVARAVTWLLSPYADAITGEIVHVDGGFHAVGAAGAGAEPAPAVEPLAQAGSAANT